MNDFLLSLFVELDLFHVGVAEEITDSPDLSQCLLGNHSEGALGTVLDALGIATAKIAFNRFFAVLMSVDCAEGAGLHAFIAGDAEVRIQFNDVVDPVQCAHRTDLRAGRFLALAADDRHPDDRMRIGDHNPDRALLRVIYPEVLGGADQFADPATGAEFRDNCQFLADCFILCNSWE